MFRILEHGGSFIVPLITFTSIYCCIFFFKIGCLCITIPKAAA